jgi:hypothetical protein
MNGNRYFLSRSFIIEILVIVGAFGLSYLLDDATPATVIVPVAVTAWFGGKVLRDSKQPKE